jgi:hypothetical protein
VIAIDLLKIRLIVVELIRISVVTGTVVVELNPGPWQEKTMPQP